MKVNIKETNLNFTNLSKRYSTDKIVIHHTGSVKDMDADARQIHDWHLNQGWAGCGYHFIIRKDGTIERGRPEWAVGSHAQGHNSNSIGIHLSGDFNAAKPTDNQIESAAMLIAYLCDKYNIPIDRNHIMGHDECYAGAGKTNGEGCPGKNLQVKLGLISGKANFYRYGAENDEVKSKPDAIIKYKIYIRSCHPIPEDTVAKIKDIFKQSNCPNESMFSSIKNFKSFDGFGTIIIDDNGAYETSFEV